MQTLASSQLKKLPSQFIRSENERPENTKAVEGVKMPVISLLSNSKPRNLVVQEISRASCDWGFFFIIDHGISPTLIQRLQEVGQEFFALPQKEKEAYANDPTKGIFEGYGTNMTYNPENKVEWIDYYFHLLSPPSKVNYNKWPQSPPFYR